GPTHLFKSLDPRVCHPHQKKVCFTDPPCHGIRHATSAAGGRSLHSRDVLMAVRVESHAEPIPGYRLLERLGGGGFGEVWRASAPGGLHKAIKFVFGDLGNADDGSQRAEQELKALSRVKTVRHPYILSLERYDIIDGQLIIVMELAERNLWDRFKECRAQGLPGIPRDE